MVYLPEAVTEKEVEDGGDVSKCGSRYGVCGMQGWRRNMEDSHLALPSFDREVALYGVFDGHGGRGVARYAAKRLPELLRETEAYKREDYGKALEQAFLAMDEKLREPAGRREVAELDQPDAAAKARARPIEVPRSVLKRILRREELEEAKSSSSPAPASAEAPAKEVGIAEAAEDLSTNGSVEVSAEAFAGAAAKTASAEASADASADASDKPAAEDSANVSDPPANASATAAAAGGREPRGGERYVEDDESDDEEEVALIDPARLMKDATPEAQGCTAVVVLVVLREAGGEGRRLYCANAGDSRAIMSRLGRVVALSEDQKPENPGETARIEKAGGYVQVMPGGARVQGDLNLSRAMGDLRYKKPEHLPPAEQILTVFPEVHCFPLTDEDHFLVLGCDGIWERSTSQQMIDFVHGRLSSSSSSPSPSGDEEIQLSQICGEACDRGLCESMDESVDGLGCDNMTMMIVRLSRTTIRASEKRPAEDVAAGAEGPMAKAQKV